MLRWARLERRTALAQSEQRAVVETMRKMARMMTPRAKAAKDERKSNLSSVTIE